MEPGPAGSGRIGLQGPCAQMRGVSCTLLLRDWENEVRCRGMIDPNDNGEAARADSPSNADMWGLYVARLGRTCVYTQESRLWRLPDSEGECHWKAKQ